MENRLLTEEEIIHHMGKKGKRWLNRDSMLLCQSTSPLRYTPFHCSCTCPSSSPSSAISPPALSPAAFAEERKNIHVSPSGEIYHKQGQKSEITASLYLLFKRTGCWQLLLTEAETHNMSFKRAHWAGCLICLALIQDTINQCNEEERGKWKGRRGDEIVT